MPSNENELKEFIGQKVGEATMQWEPIPSGVFKYEDAGKILEEIYKAIDTHTQAEVEKHLRADRLANTKFWKNNIDKMFDREIAVYEEKKGE